MPLKGRLFTDLFSWLLVVLLFCLALSHANAEDPQSLGQLEPSETAQPQLWSTLDDLLNQLLTESDALILDSEKLSAMLVQLQIEVKESAALLVQSQMQYESSIKSLDDALAKETSRAIKAERGEKVWRIIAITGIVSTAATIAIVSFRR